MSIFSHPASANAMARFMQLGTVLASRRMARSATTRLPEFTSDTEHVTIPSSIGPVRATLYRPEPADQIPAAHVNLHGGGFVLPITDFDDPICRALAAQTGAVVVNVDYAVAPQHPFPAAAHQVHEVLCWVAQNGDTHDWDGSHLTVGGQSAGGGLAAAGARLALERQGPAIALQVLHYPPLDLSVPGSAKHSTIPRPMLRPWMADVFDTAYVPDRADRADRLVSPAGDADTADIAGIAPAVVIAAAHDILRDEARRYADRLDRVSALVEYIEIPEADHGYDLKDDQLARKFYALIADHIRRASSQ